MTMHRKEHRRISDGYSEWLLRMYESGYTYRELGEMIGRSACRVMQRCDEARRLRQTALIRISRFLVSGAQ